jgi:hypothetical protein
VAGHPRKAARLCPPAIAVHDDRDMLGRRHLFAFGLRIAGDAAG